LAESRGETKIAQELPHFFISKSLAKCPIKT